MKFTVPILAVAVMVAVSPSYALKVPSTGSGELAKDLQEMFDLIPMDTVIRITKEYMVRDREFRFMLKLATSPDSRQLILFAERSPAFKKFAATLQENGLDIYSILQRYNQIQHLPPFEPLAMFNREIGKGLEIRGGINGYIQDIANVIPVDKLQDQVEEKRETSKAFSNMISTIVSREFANFMASLEQNVHYQKMQIQAEAKIGVNAEEFRTYYNFFVMLVPISNY